MYELSKELNSNWDTIRGNVELLMQLGILGMADQKVFRNPDCKVALQDDTIAGIPLSIEARKRIYALAGKIFFRWKEIAGKEPSGTQLQKAMVEISDKFQNLNIPRGWYFYGKVVMVKVDKGKLNEGNFEFNNAELDSEIIQVIKRLSKMAHLELIDYQYEKYKKEDYKIKREIESLFFLGKFDKERFSQLLYKLIFTFKLKNDDPLNQKVISLLKESASVMITHDAGRALLLETFSTFWRLYATYNLLETLEGELGYDKTIVKAVFE